MIRRNVSYVYGPSLSLDLIDNWKIYNQGSTSFVRLGHVTDS
jgi:hypothetical protein